MTGTVDAAAVEAVATWLADVAAVDDAALVAGVGDPDRPGLLAAHVAQFDRALSAARAALADAGARLAADPLRWLDASRAALSEQAESAARRADAELRDRSALALAVARLSNVMAVAVATRVAISRRNGLSR